MELFDTEIVLLEALIAIDLIVVAVGLIDLARRELRTGDKLIWLALICLLPVIGIVCYYLFIIRKKKGTTTQP